MNSLKDDGNKSPTFKPLSEIKKPENPVIVQKLNKVQLRIEMGCNPVF